MLCIGLCLFVFVFLYPFINGCLSTFMHVCINVCMFELHMFFVCLYAWMDDCMYSCDIYMNMLVLYIYSSICVRTECICLDVLYLGMSALSKWCHDFILKLKVRSKLQNAAYLKRTRTINLHEKVNRDILVDKNSWKINHMVAFKSTFGWPKV